MKTWRSIHLQALHSFFKTNPIVSNRLDEDKRVIKEVLKDVTSQVVKNIACEKKKSKKNPNNNVNDAVMTAEKASIWEKEFTFWNAEDVKVI